MQNCSKEKMEEWMGQRAQEKPEHLTDAASQSCRYTHMQIHRFTLIGAGMHCILHSSVQGTGGTQWGLSDQVSHKPLTESRSTGSPD